MVSGEINTTLHRQDLSGHGMRLNYCIYKIYRQALHIGLLSVPPFGSNKQIKQNTCAFSKTVNYIIPVVQLATKYTLACMAVMT